MSVQTTCPGCGKLYNLPDEMNGKKVRCKQCQETFLVEDVPLAELEEEIQPAPPPEKPAPKRRPVRDEEDYEEEDRADEQEDKDEDEEADERDDRGAPAKSSTGKILLIVGSVLGALFLGCCGVGGYFIYRVNKAGEEFIGQVNIEMEKQQKLQEEKRKGFEEHAQEGNPDFPVALGKQPANLDEALTDLRSQDANRRRAAAEWLARAPLDAGRQAEVAGVLGPLLADNNDAMRTSAMRALKVWATKDNVPAVLKAFDEKNNFAFTPRQEIAADIVARLKDERGAEPIAQRLPNAFANEQAKKALQEIGPGAEKAVLKYYHHSDPGARERARELLQGYGTQPSAILAQSLDDLKAAEVARRRAAVEWLAQAKPDESNRSKVASALEPLLNDADHGTSEAAVKGLQTWGGKANVPALMSVVANQASGPHASKMRQQAMETLAWFKDERAVSPVAQRLTNVVDRPFASKSLIAMGPMVEKEVAKYLNNSDRAVSEEAVKILKSIGSKENVELGQILGDLKSSDRARRQGAAQRLEKMPVDEARRSEVAKALEDTLNDSAPGGGADAAAKALVVWGTKENVPALLKALENPSNNARHAAMEALGKLKDERTAAPVAKKLLVPGDRQSAKLSLEAMGPMAEREVIPYLAQGEKHVRIDACNILKVIGTRASIGPLTTVGQAASRLKNQQDLADASREAIKAISARP